ncbi:hypothetical protein PO883_30815 [Massilia sp. DJPM01]|uniref:hypothetical protein n=1 Tax=Massilia sp. DJPM01 TaxID=3024404 RepID=UPI00259EAC5B|nr:hypothetical protein [Massilia sp. DJPM01]MDM5181572.1 hypothetical protein [Massilia sp. DJPM01]
MKNGAVEGQQEVADGGQQIQLAGARQVLLVVQACEGDAAAVGGGAGKSLRASAGKGAGWPGSKAKAPPGKA